MDHRRVSTASSGATMLDDVAHSHEPKQAKGGAELERPASQLGEPVRPTSTAASRLYSRVSGVPALDGKFDPEHEVTWDGEQDPASPYNWSPFKQWYTVMLGALSVLNCTFASSAPSENIPSYMEAFGVSEVAATLTISLFLCGYIAGPLFWGPLSESYGRRLVLLFSFFPYIAFNVGCALAPNLGALLAFRFLAGTFAAAPLSNVGPLIGDVLPARTRGLGLALFALAPFAGPALGPIVGGFIQASGTDWRWTYWVLAIFAGVCYVPLVFTMPETGEYWAQLDKRSRTFKSLAYNCLIAPFVMLFEEPMLLALTLYLSFIYGLIYGNFGSLALIGVLHGLTPGLVGLTFLPILIGGSLGTLFYVVYHSPQYQKDIAKYAPDPVPPERRLVQCYLGAIALPIAMFWLGWTGNYESISIWSPIFAVGLLGFSVLACFLALFNYIIDTYLARSGTAMAINTVVRSGFGAGFPLFTPALYGNLGIAWASTLLGCLALVGLPLPFLLARYGPKLRAMSKNAPKRPPPSQPTPAKPEDVEKAPVQH